MTSGTLHSNPPLLSNPRTRPAAPSPEATTQGVHLFFKEYLLFINPSTTEAQAETRAQQLRLGGGGLYIMPVDSFMDAFGPDGRGIYEILINGEFSHAGSLWPFIKFISKLLALLATATGLFQYTRDVNQRSFTFSFIIMGVIITTVIIHQLSSCKYFVKPKLWPQKLKRRNPAAAAATSTPWTPF